jgi:hypothetical protein
MAMPGAMERANKIMHNKLKEEKGEKCEVRSERYEVRSERYEVRGKRCEKKGKNTLAN